MDAITAKTKQRTTAALRRIAAHLPEKQCNNPLLATDAALCNALAALIAASGLTRSAVYTLHSLIRSALRTECPDGRTRWPIFWTKGRCGRWITGKEISLANTMPYQRMHRFSDTPTVRLTFERAATRILMRTTIRRPSTGRKVFSFLWGFVTHPSVSELVVAMAVGRTSVQRLLHPNPTEWIVSDPVFLKNAGSRPNAYTHYRAALGRPVQLIALVRHVRWLSLLFRDGLQILDRPLHPSDFGLPMRSANNVPRRWRQPSSDASSVAGSSDRFSLDALGVEDRDVPVEWIRPTPRRGTERVHYFQASEIRALYLACGTLFERILFTSLFTTGMRIGGFCSLAYHHPITNEMSGIEKGNVLTTYCVTDVLRRLLGEWTAALPHRTDRQYLFPGRDAGPDSHIAPSTVRRMFHRVARRAGVTGSHVHPHTTRHTVAWTLHALGNSVDRVAGFVGHKSPQVTSQVYIALTQTQQRALVDCPWLNTKTTGDARQQMRAEAEQMALAIGSPFGSVDGRTFPSRIDRTSSRASLGRLVSEYFGTHDARQ